VDRELKRGGNIDESSEAHSSVVFRFLALDGLLS
jgi:hypothetical protein